MSKAGLVYYNDVLAGRLEFRSNEYTFTYDPAYLADGSLPSISLSLPKSRKEHRSSVLFPFFFGLLAEGVNKDVQCRALKIDEEDHFTRLLRTAGESTIGAITVREVQ
jgi:serine/threonine-protein kinase HipA